jgi:WD40 repeat protein
MLLGQARQDGDRRTDTNNLAEVKLWDVATGKECGGWKARSLSIEAVAVSPNGKVLATGGEDAMVRLWGLATGRELAVLKGHGGRG